MRALDIHAIKGMNDSASVSFLYSGIKCDLLVHCVVPGANTISKVQNFGCLSLCQMMEIYFHDISILRACLCVTVVGFLSPRHPHFLCPFTVSLVNPWGLGECSALNVLEKMLPWDVFSCNTISLGDRIQEFQSVLPSHEVLYYPECQVSENPISKYSWSGPILCPLKFTDESVNKEH